jgi:hypothetical protein
MIVTELHPNVVVYSELYGNPQAVIDHYRATNTWNQWFVYGETTALADRNYQFDAFPSEQEWQAETINSDKSISDAYLAVLNAFYKSTSHYRSNFFTEELPNWTCDAPSLCMYKTNGGAAEDVGMFYHTDFPQERADAPGSRPALTCTMYLNDDYEGGSIKFKILKENETDFDYFSYKPKAGDVLVFPSKSPYYHAVDITTSGQKYFVRSFWQYEFPGTPDWLENQKLYGHEKWAEMEKERERTERNSGRYNLNGEVD